MDDNKKQSGSGGIAPALMLIVGLLFIAWALYEISAVAMKGFLGLVIIYLAVCANKAGKGDGK